MWRYNWFKGRYTEGTTTFSGPANPLEGYLHYFDETGHYAIFGGGGGRNAYYSLMRHSGRQVEDGRLVPIDIAKEDEIVENISRATMQVHGKPSISVEPIGGA